MPSAALDRFFDHYFARRPVNATFTGMHTHDDRLPDWSPSGLDALDDEMRAIGADLASAHPTPTSARGYREDVALLDADLARAFLDIQRAENASAHGPRGNPALWTGEAVFSVISLMITRFAPLDTRVRSATARLSGIPAFLADAQSTLGSRSIPEAWTARALREIEGATILLTRGIERWLASGVATPTAPAQTSGSAATELGLAAARANAAFADFAGFLRACEPAPGRTSGSGGELYDLLLSRGHQSARSRRELLTEVRQRFSEEREALDEMARTTAGSWPAAQDLLAADHAAPPDYLNAFRRIWDAAHECAAAHDAVRWPDWPVRYVTYPEWTRDAAPYLYYLHYRSPAPFDRVTVHDYVVPPLPAEDATAHLRAWNNGVMKLNHVAHHGGIGHHVQNWHAYHEARSRIGQIAAVDCASRIGMFCGGTMAEGWACYATGLMQEFGFLTPLEALSEQHARVRFLARAIVDIEMHQGTMSLDAATRFYAEQVGMNAAAARGEAVKNSMFPCTAIMYWLGTEGILDLRARLQKARGRAWSLRTFHDELLGHGSLPVPLITRMMTEDLA